MRVFDSNLAKFVTKLSHWCSPSSYLSHLFLEIIIANDTKGTKLSHDTKLQFGDNCLQDEGAKRMTKPPTHTFSCGLHGAKNPYKTTQRFVSRTCENGRKQTKSFARDSKMSKFLPKAETGDFLRGSEVTAQNRRFQMEKSVSDGNNSHVIITRPISGMRLTRQAIFPREKEAAPLLIENFENYENFQNFQSAVPSYNELKIFKIFKIFNEKRRTWRHWISPPHNNKETLKEVKTPLPVAK